MTRRAHGAALGLALLAASLAAHAVPEPDDIAGPPPYSINGCAANVAWTPSYLASVFGVTERAVRRAKNKMGMDPVSLCTAPWASTEWALHEASMPKAGYDMPDKALEFRALSLRSDDGTIADDGVQKSHAQRQALLDEAKAKLGGLTPGAPFWTALGPGNAGGRVRAVLPLSTTRILIGSVSGGLWLTEDAGASWTVVRDLMPSVAITCLVQDPLDATVIYVCTGEGFQNIDAVRGDGIWKITGANGAPATWAITQVPGTTPANGAQWRYVSRLAVLPNPADPNNLAARIFVAAAGNFSTGGQGLYRSVDGGTGFTLARSGSYRDVKYHPQDSTRFVAADAQGGVAYSPDRGATWFAPATGFPIASAGRVELGAPSGVPGVWFASVYIDEGQLWRSTDNGVNWTRRDVSGFSLANTPSGGVLGSQGWYDNVVWASPDGNRVLVGGVGIRLSLDGGLNFGVQSCSPPNCPLYAAGLPNIHPDHHAIVSATDYGTSGIVYFGQDGGVFKANIGAQATNLPGSIFTTLNNGLQITQFYGGAGAGAGGTLRVTGGTQDNGSWTWNGTAWQMFNGGDGGEGAVDPSNTQFVYGEFQLGVIYRSSSGGTGGGTIICQGILDISCNNGVTINKANFIPHFILDPNNADRMLFGGESVWRTDNVRTSNPGQPAWTAIKGPQTSRFCQADPTNTFCNPPNNPNTVVSFVAVAPGNPNLAWVGYNDGQLVTTSNATAASPSWTNIAYSGVTAPQRMVTRILVDPSNNQRVWVGLGGYNTGNVLLTTNGGTSWTDVHGNLPSSPVRALVRHPTLANTVYAGTEVGVFASDVAGTTWSAQSEGPGSVSVEELFFLDNTTLYASTHGRGMFRTTVNPATLPGSLQFTAASVSVQEGSSLQLQVSRAGGSFGAAGVNFATGSGTATTGVDFTATTGSLTWAAGDTATKTITIPTATDALAEGVETFTVTLSGATGATLGSPSVATVSLADPDTFPLGGALPPGAWSQPNTTPAGTADPSIVKGWVIDSSTSFEGGLSLRADSIGDSQKAVIELRAYTGAGNLSFARRVSSENGFDCLRFFIDGVAQNIGGSCANVFLVGASGEVPWGLVSFPVAAGMHTLRWSYEKDVSLARGSDAAWIDAISLPATGLDPAADPDNDGVPTGVELNEAINPTVKDNDIFSATPKGARLFAMQQYRDFLGREGDAGGIAFYVNLLNTGTLRANVTENFFNSPEFQSTGAAIVRLYAAFFNRIPDHGGFVFQTNALRTGTSLSVIANNFTLAPEFVATYGALTNTQYVTLLYQNVLGRVPVQSEIDFHVARLAGGVTRGEVMIGFSESPEYIALKANGVYAIMLYEGLLRRAAEQAGFDFYVNLLNTGTPGASLITNFQASTEYRSRFLP